ncbi:MAG: S41 family peptidase [Vicinamibacteria bacterium]
MKRVAGSAWSLLLLVLATGPALAQAGVSGYYRYPVLHGDTLVFTAEGDLWSAAAVGGVARRLTTHPGEENHPVISPDGRTLAFTARYEGPAEVYTMPLAGGLPVRRTYEGEAAVATTFTPAGELVYATTHYATLPDLQLVALDLASGERRRIPLSQASEASYDGDGRTLYFVRPAFHNNVTRRYTGGTARRVWKFTQGAGEAVLLSAGYAGESHTPMWWNGRVYFVSDRDGTMNLWSMDEAGGDLRQHTRHDGFDVRFASLSAGRVAYTLGADIRLYEIASNRDALVPVTLASDLDQLREKWVKKPIEYLTSAHLHPKGESVVLTARGRVFVAPAGAGRLAQASRRPGVRYRDVVFMPDGKSLLALSDASGELEFVTLPSNGVGDETALTRDGGLLRFEGVPSPDGRFVAYSDNHNEAWLFEVASKARTRLSTNEEGVADFAWAPDSRYLAFSQQARNSFAQIQLYDVQRKSLVALTSDRANSVSAAFSPDGQWLYFLSDRNLDSAVGAPWGPRQPEPFFAKPMKIYQLALKQGLRSPFKPADELHPDAPEKPEGEEKAKAVDGKGGTKAAEAKPAARPLEIDLEGIQQRLYEVPAPAGDYAKLSVGAKALFWSSTLPASDDKTELMAMEIGNQEPKPAKLVEDVRGYELSRDGRKLLVRRREELLVFDAGVKPPADLTKARVDLSAWSFPLDVREDWRQIFVDAWRLERDYFYDRGMHGLDWNAMRDKYLPLVERVTTRDELSDLIGRVVGELQALHTSVRGGDLRQGPDDVKVPTLGARLVRDAAAGGWRIEHVYRADPDYPHERSPLADPELGIAEGDVILRVNGVDTLSVAHPNALLRNQGGKQVLLRVRPGRGGEPRDVVATPTTEEASLRYADWELSRRLRAEQRSGGRVGYVHLRAMGESDVTAWYRSFYPVFDRAGLIIDVRHNRGGNIDSFILEKLLRKAWMYWKSRAGEPSWNMQYAFRGHMVVLIDENTASDGEAFADGFRRLGLGKLIGVRTWGGEIWLGSQNRLSDGGLARAPMMGVYGPERQWLIEQHGVEPDIEVQNLPHATFGGQDAQLEAAIAELLAQIEKDPRPVPSPPAYPDKSRRPRND